MVRKPGPSQSTFSPEVTEELASFATSVEFEALPSDVRDHTIDLLVDQLGCQIANAKLPWSAAAVDAVNALHPPGNGNATVLVHGLRHFVDDAAFLNGVFGSANEIDDVHLEAGTHPGAVVIPAALAVAEVEGSSGVEFLSAIVAGYEVMIRIALAANPVMMRQRHHHSPLALGPFGAAAAAGRLMKLDTPGMVAALSIAASYSGGVMEYTRGGGSAKRLHTGIGAQGGVAAASHARAGITGPRRMIEGERGFLEAFANRDKVDGILRGLGKQYRLLDTGFKNYYAMYPIHAAIQSVEAINERTPLRAADIESVEVFAGRAAVVNTAEIVHPTDTLGAQFSMRFALATTVKFGSAALRSLTTEHLSDEEVNALAERITVEYSDAFGETQGAEVRVRARGGKIEGQSFRAPLGSPGQPMTREQVWQKFVRMVAPVYGQIRAEQLREQISRIQYGSVRDLAAVLATE